MDLKNILFNFKGIKFMVIGLFVLAVFLFRDGCDFYPTNRITVIGNPEPEELSQAIPHSSQGYFVAIRSSNIYVKPNITSETYYKINEGTKIYVEKLDEWNYFYTYKEGGETQGYLLKDDFRRAD